MNESTDEQDPQRPRKVYETPRLIDHGDVRDVTLGGSPGVGDSAPPTTNPLT